ncbi:metallophosphoesterase family protein [Flaviaesturariibacter aridisoli]|uniref:Metallophosphoesterase n=1 Tax=Flaviaesturariibacter aridisoli TaxID=2545761 RepID=A0A4R4E158_9BACT|nr:metallophosphoesterase [Flaviaesturariibacter aridisoli]TCZ68291.1 metallophosphoesterase [Flaviaesturariibacter aridisoli]
MAEQASKVRIAAVGDIHVRENDTGKWGEFFKEVSRQADVLVIVGDLTDTGDEGEAEVLANEMKQCAVPIVAVLGNHDYEKGRHKLIRSILMKADMHILDGEAVVVKDVGFAGVKGFGGGFDKHVLSMFGEGAMKAFVQEAVDEALHLERALSRLDQEHNVARKIALMHYAPIKETVLGEPEQIFPFLGCSRLAEPLGRHGVLAAFHGHAHVGTLEGRTHDGVPVFNVAKPILSKLDLPFFVFEV